MTAEQESRLYTVDEANATLAELRESLVRIREARREVLRSGRRVGARAGANGGGPEGTAYLEALSILREEVERLAAEDIILRDAESGLVDFPSEREGRVVQLCWKLGEDRVAHWHENDAGFQARKPL
ncbi:MAG TPA: DUF2203 domain-containing protein [Actinomycetota bacterium]|jgi:hypothetical protein|nr:DUF2203 domain-containing protein [Actinomycetota bacterium]